MSQGFIGLHRKIMENQVWCDPHYLKLWLYCLLKASHKKHKILVGNQFIELERGQFVTGRNSLEEELNKGMKPEQRLNGLTWFRYLNNLEKWQMLNIKKTNKYSLVTVVNYDYYQHSDSEVEQQVEHQLNISCSSVEHQLNTNKNVNNVKKDNKDIYVEIINYLNEKSNSNFTTTAKATVKIINARLSEKFTVEDFKLVIDYCCREWKGKTFPNGKLGDDYLRPTTLFNEKFDERLNVAKKNQPTNLSPAKPKEQMKGIGEM
jgi:uncharacterized phage protein (TIGR02220 family)